MKFSARSIFHPTIPLSLALMAVIVMMILPMPPLVLDIGLAASFALAILIFTVTLFIERPLDFSAFPTILLASLMLRLSLNVSSTKLIIADGHTGTQAAGNVIEGFAMFIMGGSVFLGLIVFCVLLIVNFLVITKGAARMAEVGARFALDGMPGKQLAIDSDVSAGAIGHEEAKARRQIEQQETTFFGSLDGTSKFVKGDAIAGLLITLMNMIMGLIIGTMIHDMALGQAFETYAILTVGDGLVSQIPAVIISIASALLLARGGLSGSTDVAFFKQLGRYPAALATVSLLMVLFALVPGLPFLPFVAGAIVLGVAAYFGELTNRRIAAEEVEKSEDVPEILPHTSLGDILDLDDIHVQFAPDLVSLVLDPATGLDTRISNMRNHVATEFGLILPDIRLTDDPSLPSSNYSINVQGVECARDVLHPGKMLAILPSEDDAQENPDQISEPVYGAPARWIARDQEEQVAQEGATIVSPTEVLATHLLEVIKSNFGRLLNLKSLRRLLSEVTNLSDQTRSDANRQMLDEIIPDKVPTDLLLSVLKLLLDERVSIRNLPVILESIAESRGSHATPESICEHVRHRLGFQIVAQLKRIDGSIPLIQLAPEWEERFSAFQVDGERGAQDVALPPEDFSKLANGVNEKVSKAGENGIFPAVITSTRRRRFLRTVLEANAIKVPVLSFEEIGTDAKPALVGLVSA